MVEAVEPFKLYPTSMSYIYKVFEHLKQLWMGIWQHTHTVTTTEVSPDLGKFTEILVSKSFLSFRYAFVIPFCLFSTMCISITIKY